jgi:hypothetical protein
MLREDLDDNPEAAQMNCGEISNIFGLMNHDCKPTAKLQGERVSGKFRVTVVTAWDIRDWERTHY